jgi:hypothetical protein
MLFEGGERLRPSTSRSCSAPLGCSHLRLRRSRTRAPSPARPRSRCSRLGSRSSARSSTGPFSMGRNTDQRGQRYSSVGADESASDDSGSFGPSTNSSQLRSHGSSALEQQRNRIPRQSSTRKPCDAVRSCSFPASTMTTGRHAFWDGCPRPGRPRRRRWASLPACGVVPDALALACGDEAVQAFTDVEARGVGADAEGLDLGDEARVRLCRDGLCRDERRILALKRLGCTVAPPLCQGG